MQDSHQDTLRRSSNEHSSHEDSHKSGPGPVLRQNNSSCTPGKFPGLSGSNHKRGKRSDLASEFWSQGVPNLIGSFKKGRESLGDSTALVKKPAIQPLKEDFADSAPVHSSDAPHNSEMLSCLEPSSNTVDSSSGDDPTRRLPNSSIEALKMISNHEDELPHCSPGDSMEIIAPDVAGRDLFSEVKAQRYRSPVLASASNRPSVIHGGDEYKLQMSIDATSLSPERSRSESMSHPKIKDQPSSHPGGRPKHAIPGRSICDKNAASHPSGNSGLFLPEQRRNPYQPPKTFQGNNNNEGASAEAPPRSLPPITPTKNPAVRHPRSFSAEAAQVYPKPSSNSPMTPRSSHSNDHRRSVSIGNGFPNPTYASVMPNTPIHQPPIWQPTLVSIGTPSTPVESGVFYASGASSPYFFDPHYPEPHQHTPEGEAQMFGIQGPMPLLIPAGHSPYPFNSNISPFSRPMQSSHNATSHHDAQVYKQIDQNAEFSQSNHFDSYATSQAPNATPNAADLHQNGNMYTQDTNGYGPRFYSNHTDPARQVSTRPPHMYRLYEAERDQLNQNLYSPLEPHREPSKSHQRTARDLFIPEDIRLKLHSRTEATLRVFAGRLL